ncbi:MAG: IS4 family transposase [Prochloraceae cyanobacterium]|nr:IS4 family transposase [Prochloraceae cyanobacterium]
MLPEFYINYLKSYLKDSELLTLQILVWLLQVHKEVKIEKLASNFPYPIKCDSRRKKIKRFLILPVLSVTLLWLPLIKKIIETQFKPGETLTVIIDRTQWEKNNILMASVVWNNRALPLYWLLLNKQGATNFYEQVAVIKPILRLLKKYKIVVIGDREFRSTALASWLGKKKVGYIFRLNKTTKIKPKYQKYQALKDLQIKPGDRIIYPRSLVTEENLKDRFNVVIYWKRKYKNQQNPEPWYLITNLQNKDEVIKLYSQRMAIEAMFRDYKKGGYNLEGTKANEQRLTSLILLVAHRASLGSREGEIAYTFSSLKGLKIRKIGHQEYINRLKDKEDKYSKHSYFWTGLYGSTWVLGMDICWEWVEKLMRTTRNKLPFYQKGLRAMELIQRRL